MGFILLHSSLPAPLTFDPARWLLRHLRSSHVGRGSGLEKQQQRKRLNCDAQTNISPHTAAIRRDFQVPTPRTGGKVVGGGSPLSKFNSQVQITDQGEARLRINEMQPNEQLMHERGGHGGLNRPTTSLSITPTV